MDIKDFAGRPPELLPQTYLSVRPGADNGEQMMEGTNAADRSLRIPSIGNVASRRKAFIQAADAIDALSSSLKVIPDRADRRFESADADGVDILLTSANGTKQPLSAVPRKQTS